MGSSKQSSPAQPDPTAQAQQLQNAKNTLDPQAAQLQYNILSNPDYGILPTTQLMENTRQQVFPQEQLIRQQLGQNVLGGLQSPTGITPEQQAAINARRGLAQSQLVESIRDRQNLGGTLYGGRSQLEENRSVGELQNAFAEEDINREERSRQNAYAQAFPYLQLLFPDVNLTAPNFQSSVQDPNTYASGVQNANNLAYQQANAQAAQKSQLYSALFSGLGTAAGGALGGPLGAGIGGQAGGAIGGQVGGTGKTQSQILGYNTAQYR